MRLNQWLTIWCLVIILCGAAPHNTLAASDEVLIFVLDPKIVVEHSLAFRSIQQQLATRNNAYKKKALSQHNTLETAYRELESQKGNISQQEYEQRSRKLAQQAREYNKHAHADKARIDKALAKATSHIEQVLDEIMAVYVKKIEATESGKKILIINKLNVVYANNNLDITEKICKELDIKLPKVQVVFDD